MNIITTVGKPCSAIPAIGNVFSTQAYIALISQQISEGEEVRSHVRALMPMFSVRAAWRIYWSTKRYLNGRLEDYRQEKLERYHEWLRQNL